MMFGKGNINFKKMLLAASSFATGKEGSSTHPEAIIFRCKSITEIYLVSGAVNQHGA